MNKRRPLHLSLIKTISSMTGDNRQSIKDAHFVARMATDISIEGQHLTEVLRVVNRKLRELEGEFAHKIRKLLEKVKEQFLEQIHDQTRPISDKMSGFEARPATSNQDNVPSLSSSQAEIA